ncbi:flagellar biosynthesis anti-sigma factor FlgM [Endozoicomonas sp. 8E]|uniref:flagellar biosynthesis anti-sigma factor FlgM n=1 Tax=Endozoicomonas sp. 8E TaxID=3035692 RepID=UPI0029390EE0|nr:flagellar biosynthesis anti-sigma factor FlgM [Endozoicomonas sp. 8E]WOG29078.1 flagellar biosynthesis anti-sigma factor FlgM [Endozoicomonas sp. 8E]
MPGINRTGPKKAASPIANQHAVKNDAKNVEPPKVNNDRLQLSGEAQNIEELFQSLSAIDEIDSKKVESIRRAIKKGEMPVDYQVLANKILELSDDFDDHRKE